MRWIKLFKRKKAFKETNYKKKYRRLKIITLLITLFTVWLIYSNFNYLVFKFLISYNYAYTVVLDEIYEEAIGYENIKGYFRNFDDTVIAVYSDKIREVGDDRYTFLYTPIEYNFSRDSEREVAKGIFIEELTNDTVLLYIPNISKQTREFIENNTDVLAQYSNVIIDLRGNLGGRLDDMYKIADLFLERGMIIAAEQTRMSLTSRTAVAGRNTPLVYENIYIVVNGRTASAAEGLTMALSENLDNVTIIGLKTFGKGIGQITIPLKYGFATRATTMETRTPSGNTINRVGIMPDIIFDDDDILDYILGRL